MAEEEKKEAVNEQEAQEPQAEEQAEEPAAEPAAEVATEEAEEPAAEEVKPEKPVAVAKPAPKAEGEGVKSPKQLRKLGRSKFTGKPGQQRTPEQRAAERAETRAKKAVVRRRWRSQVRRKAKESASAAPAPPPPAPAERRAGNRKVRQGTVIGNSADKTISVRVVQIRQHPVYKKTMRVSSTLHAHDEKNEAKPGDLVRVTECRPLSRTKRWRLTQILERAR